MQWFQNGELVRRIVTDTNWPIVRKAILTKVKRIDAFTTERWQGQTVHLWKDLCQQMGPKRMVMQRKPRRGEPNWYCVVKFVEFLQAEGVYRQDVTLMTLDMAMEQTKVKSVYYRHKDNVTLSLEEKSTIRALLRSQ